MKTVICLPICFLLNLRNPDSSVKEPDYLIHTIFQADGISKEYKILNTSTENEIHHQREAVFHIIKVFGIVIGTKVQKKGYSLIIDDGTGFLECMYWTERLDDHERWFGLSIQATIKLSDYLGKRQATIKKLSRNIQKLSINIKNFFFWKKTKNFLNFYRKKRLN